MEHRGILRATAKVEIETYTDEQIQMLLDDPNALDEIVKELINE
ncbi:hypothetical protein [Campylobacter sputorum]|nr:hypothetical protein [Campylobacter sputorum]